MNRAALLISALSLTFVAAVPAQAKDPAQGNAATKSAKIKKVKVRRGVKPAGQQTAAQSGESATTGTGGTQIAANGVGRAIPVAAAHANFFATPLGLLTAAGAAGGTAAGAAALSSQGSGSSPN